MNPAEAHSVIFDIINGDSSSFNTLNEEERFLIKTVLKELTDKGSSKTLEAVWATDFERKPVSIDTFLDDKYFLGHVGESIFPLWRKELRFIHDPKNEIVEWIIRGSIGSGKSTIAVISMLYRIYYLTCMVNPQKYYGLTEKSPIVFGLFNIFKYLAKATSYQYLISWMKLSPYFQETIRKSYSNEKYVPSWLKRSDTKISDAKDTFIQLPKSIMIAVGSQAIHALGMAIHGGLLDEADLGKSRSTTDNELSQVADLYSQVRSRMDSRFIQSSGNNPGLLCMVSQVRGEDSFLEQHVRKVQNNPHTHVTAFSLWEIKSHIFKGQSTFKVIVGDQQIRSFIPTDEQLDQLLKTDKSINIIDVPESLRTRFEYDIDEAIRDLAGIPTYGIDLFLSRRDKLYECYASSTARKHPFISDEVVLSIEAEDTKSIIDYFEKPECMVEYEKTTGSWRPKWYPGADRAVHVDLALNKDCAGLAVGTIGDIRAVTRFDQDEKPYKSTDYTIFIDFAIRLRAAKGSEIDFSKIRQFIYYLHHIGYPIRYISYDGFQSVDSMQQFKKAGFDVKLLSVDKKANQYNYLRSTIMEGRLDFYEYDIFTDEITKLQDYTLVGGKPPIDHPPKGSKDVTDSVCGVVSRLLEVKQRLTPSMESKELDERLKFMASGDKEADSLIRFKDQRWVAGKLVKGNLLDKLFNIEDSWYE